jgi:ATP-binding protein involved in chromosome partitioning
MKEEEILKALSHVDDPDLRKDIVSLGMVKNLNIEGNRVRFDVELTTPACPMKDAIKKACITAITHIVNREAEVLPNMTSKVTSQRSESTVLKGVKNIIAVASGKGGVGKSTVSVNLAWALLETGASVGLLDADLHGPSIPTMTGIIRLPPMYEGQPIEPAEIEGLKVMSIGFMIDPKQALIWRGPMVASALKQLILNAHWGDLDYLIIDLPPGTGDTHLSLVQEIQLSGAIIVSTPQQVALADCRKAIGMFRVPQINVPMLGVVENMSWFSPKDTPDKKYYLFGRDGGQVLADEFDMPLLVQIPIIEEIMQNADTGKKPDFSSDLWQYYAFLAGEVARQMAIKNAAVQTA